MNRSLIRAIFVVTSMAAVGAAIGLGFGAAYGWAAVSFGLLVLVLHHARELGQLTDWLKNPDSTRIPAGSGAWRDAFYHLYRLQRSRVAKQQQLAKTLARFRQAGQALPEGVVILDEEEKIEWCNTTAQNHFALDYPADFGRPITNLVRQPDFVAYLESKDYSKSVTFHSARGAGLMLAVQLVPYGESQKLLLSRDVTQLEKIETVRRDFIANVSHELRTPLTVLAGFLETVRELDLDPVRRKDYLSMMADQAKRMEHIVEDLLTLSSLESAAPPPDNERVKLDRLFLKLGSDAEALGRGKHHIALEREPGLDLLGSESEIVSAFGNLVSNAIRYTPPGGDIKIIWRELPDGAEFAVQDTGIGIEAEHISRLTERFYRVDRGRSRETGGTGLGLAIVKHALLRHQAVLHIESEPGKGSRFAARFSRHRLIEAADETQGAGANAPPA